MKLLSFVLVIFFVCCAQPLHAEPMFIEFTEMMQQAQTIVIGDYLGFINPAGAIHEPFGMHQIAVKEVLKGNAKLGLMPVSRAHGAIENELTTKTSCIAFLNARNEFEWVATAENGSNFEKDILFLRGFYDWNAYMVYPGGITILQLKEYLEKGYFSFAVAGNLNFYNPATQTMQPSEAYFELSTRYPDEKQDIKVSNLDLGDFKKLKPGFSLPGYSGDGCIFSLEYEPNMVRPLKFSAALQGFDEKTQRFKAMFWVTDPEEMDATRFKEYLQNEQHGHSYYEIEIQTKKGKTYTFVYHEERGSIGNLVGYDQSLWQCGSFSDPSTEETADMVFGYDREESVIIRMDKLKEKIAYYDYPYRQDELVRALRVVGNIKGQVIFKDKTGKEQFLDNCTIRLKATKWAKNINSRKK